MASRSKSEAKNIIFKYARYSEVKNMFVFILKSLKILNFFNLDIEFY